MSEPIDGFDLHSKRNSVMKFAETLDALEKKEPHILDAIDWDKVEERIKSLKVRAKDAPVPVSPDLLTFARTYLGCKELTDSQIGLLQDIQKTLNKHKKPPKPKVFEGRVYNDIGMFTNEYRSFISEQLDARGDNPKLRLTVEVIE